MENNLETSINHSDSIFKNDTYIEQDEDEEGVECKIKDNTESSSVTTGINKFPSASDQSSPYSLNFDIRNMKSTRSSRKGSDTSENDKQANIISNATDETKKSTFYNNDTFNAINNNNLNTDKYSNIINSLMLGTTVGLSNNLSVDIDECNIESNFTEKLPYSTGHPLFGHGVCKWPGCEVAFDDLQAFAK